MAQNIRYSPLEVPALVCLARGGSGSPLTLSDGVSGLRTLYTPEEAQFELVTRFGPLIARFVRILLTGRFRRNDKHAIAFLGLFAKSSTPPEQTAMMLKQCLRNYHKNDDLFQEGVLAFLEAIQKGDNISGSFPSFFSNRIDGMINDIIHSPKCQLESERDLIANESISIEKLLFSNLDMESFYKELTDDEVEWVESVLAGEEVEECPASIKEKAFKWLSP